MENLSAANITNQELEARKHVKKHHMSRKARDYIFIIVILAYPVLQFLLTWSFVNINSILMAFQKRELNGSYVWTLENFERVFVELFDSKMNHTGIPWLNDASVILFNSLGYCFITLFISLPLSVLFSYFLQKKMPLANLFRAIFFLPNIIPIVALAFSFTISFDSTYGYLYDLMLKLGFSDNFMGMYPTNQIMIYIYCIWAGLGYNIILISGAIGRIPKELFESAELDHAGYFKEFFHIVVPCIWPTIVTLIVMGMTNVLTLYLHPMLITGGAASTYSISLSIFDAASGGSPAQQCAASAYGLVFSVIWAPIILLVRHFTSKKFQGVGY